MAAKKRVSSRNLSQLSPAEKQIYARRMQTTSGERGAARQAAFEKQRIARSRRIGLPKLPEAAPQATAEPATRPPTRPTTLAGKAGRASAQAQRGLAQAGRAAGRGMGAAGKVVTPIALATEAVRAVNLATDPEAVQEAAAAYEDLADSNSFMRAVEGGLRGLDTIAGYVEQAKNMRQSIDDADLAEERAQAALNSPEGLKVQRDAASRRAAARQFGFDKAEQLELDLKNEGKEGLEVWKIIRNDPKAMAQFAEQYYAAREQMPAEETVVEDMTDEEMETEEVPTETGPEMPTPSPAESEPAAEMAEEEPEAAPPKAIPVAPEDDEMLSTLFKTATGTPFDPKSSRDADYMKKIRETLAEQGGLKGMTPTQFALKLYRKYD